MKHSLIFLLLSASAALAQNPASKPAKTEPALCTVSGRVVKKTTGEPLKSARVLLKEDTSAQGHHYTEFTDASGQFTFKSVAPGRYDFAAHRNGYVEQDYRPEGAGSSVVLELTPGQKLDKVLFRLTAAAAVVGKIVDENGEPAPAIVVQVLAEESSNGKKVLDPIARALTDDLGQFRLFGIPPGEYYFNAIDPGTPDISPIDFVQGIRYFNSDETSAKHPPSYYPGVLHRDQAQKITLKAGDEFHLDLALGPVKAALTVSGIVIGPSGNPVAGALVYLSDRNEEESTDLSHNGTNTDSKGHFEMSNVLPSNYAIGASLQDKDKLYTAMELIDVASENITNIRIVLKAPASVTGTVVAQGSSDFVFQNMFVGADSTDTTVTRAPSGGGMIQRDGTFKFPLLESTYGVHIQGLPEGWYLRSARLDGEDVFQHGMKVQGSASQKLELQISHTAASLAGTMMIDDKPAIGAYIKLVPVQENPSRGDLVKGASTDQNGHFIISSIVPGTYKVQGKFGDKENEDDENKSKEETESNHKSVEMKVELGENEAKTIKLEMKEKN